MKLAKISHNKAKANLFYWNLLDLFKQEKHKTHVWLHNDECKVLYGF